MSERARNALPGSADFRPAAPGGERVGHNGNGHHPSAASAEPATGRAAATADPTPTPRQPVTGHTPVAETTSVLGGASALDGASVVGETSVPGDASASVGEPAGDQTHDVWDRRVAGGLAFLRRRLSGQYDVDEFGFDRDLTEQVIHPLLRPLYRDWFRTDVYGIQNVPDVGGALIVGNHSGTIALDALMLSVALRDRHPLARHLRLLGADLIFRMPVFSELARKSGATVACNPDAERLMSTGELVGVFPEGFKGIGKHYSQRYRLQRFGRGGFVAAALRTGAPIVPVAIVGAEETYPLLAEIKPLARLLGLPFFPVTPTFPWLGPLGLVPLPSKWLIEFCRPIPTEHLMDQADDPLVVYNLADQVRETIQHALHELLERRPDPFGL